MNLKRCENGHFYDADRYDCCPHCGKTDMPQAEPSPVNELLEGIKCCDGTTPFVFISYCHKDKIVYSVLEQLQKNEYSFWYDEGIKTGEKWRKEITENIKNCTQFVVFISENALNSENVKDEIHFALTKKKEIVVIRLDDCELDDELELSIGRIQSVNRGKYSSFDAFCKKIFVSLKPATLRKSNDVKVALNALVERYDIIRQESESGFSVHYIARDKKTSATVMIKHLSFNQSYTGEIKSKLFYNELKILKMLHDCPYCAHLLDYFKDSNNAYIVQNYIKGKTVSDIIEKNSAAMPAELAMEIAIDVAEALCYLYVNKPRIAHLDIKPNNIIIAESGHAYLIDFGISEDEKPPMLDGFLPRTSNNAMGTRGYASPERYEGVVDCRSDIYSLGIVLYQLLTGKKSVRDVDTPDFYTISVDIPDSIKKIVLKMTAKNIDERYSTPIELLYDLRHYKDVNKLADRFTKGADRYSVRSAAPAFNPSYSSYSPMPTSPIPAPPVVASAFSYFEKENDVTGSFASPYETVKLSAENNSDEDVNFTCILSDSTELL